MRVIPILCFVATLLPVIVMAEGQPLPAANTGEPAPVETSIEHAAMTPVSPQEVQKEVLEYRARWTKLTVGNGRVIVIKAPEYTSVEYRMNFEIKVFGARAYHLDSHQQVIFDTEGKLLRSQTAADINGKKSSGSIKLLKGVYEVDFDGKTKQLDPQNFVFTTMSSLYRIPVSGDWLDITNGEVVSYKVKEDDGSFQIERSDGSDELSYNESGYMVKIKSAIKVGSVILERQDEAVKRLDDLISPEAAILDDDGKPLETTEKEQAPAKTEQQARAEAEDQNASLECQPDLCSVETPS
jgi:hypothetical protein